MTAEILSIIAVCISGVTAICAASIPAILNYRIKKEELKDKRKQLDDEKFEIYYQAHWQVLKDFAELYEQWKADPYTSFKLIDFIKEIAPEFRLSINNWLYKFADKIAAYKPGENLDDDYKRCRQLILDSYGVRVSANTPDDFMSDILRVVLRERFDELQHATSKDFKFHRR